MFKFSNLVYVPSLTNQICSAKATSTGLAVDILGIKVPIWLNQKDGKKVQAFSANTINYHNLVSAYPELEKPKFYNVIFSYETTKSVGKNSFYRKLLILTKTCAIMSTTYNDNGTVSTVTKEVIIDISKIRKDNTKFETPNRKSSILCTETGFICLVEGLYFDVPLTNEQHAELKRISVYDSETVLFKQSVMVPISLEDKSYYDYIMMIYPNKILIDRHTIVGNQVSKSAVMLNIIDFRRFINGFEPVSGNESIVESCSEGFLIKFKNDFVTIPVTGVMVDYLKSLGA